MNHFLALFLANGQPALEMRWRVTSILGSRSATILPVGRERSIGQTEVNKDTTHRRRATFEVEAEVEEGGERQERQDPRRTYGHGEKPTQDAGERCTAAGGLHTSS